MSERRLVWTVFRVEQEGRKAELVNQSQQPPEVDRWFDSPDYKEFRDARLKKVDQGVEPYFEVKVDKVERDVLNKLFKDDYLMIEKGGDRHYAKKGESGFYIFVDKDFQGRYFELEKGDKILPSGLSPRVAVAAEKIEGRTHVDASANQLPLTERVQKRNAEKNRIAEAIKNASPGAKFALDMAYTKGIQGDMATLIKKEWKGKFNPMSVDDWENLHDILVGNQKEEDKLEKYASRFNDFENRQKGTAYASRE